MDKQEEANKAFTESLLNLSKAIANLSDVMAAFDVRLSMLEKDKSSLILPKGVN